MRNTWPIAVAILLLVTATTLSGIRAAEDRATSIASNLGWPGTAVRLTVVADEDSAATAPLWEFAEQTGTSLAYTPWSDSGVVIVVDREQRFAAVDGPGVVDGRGFYGSAAVVPVADAAAAQLGLVGAALRGTLAPGVGFAGSTVHVLAGPQPHMRGSGEYLFAGPRLDELAGTLESLDRGAFFALDVAVDEPVSWWGLHTVGAVLRAVYTAFSLGVVALMAVLSLGSHARRLSLAAVLGARRREMMRMLWEHHLPPCALGLAAGAASASAIALSYSDDVRLGSAELVKLVAGALGVSTIVVTLPAVLASVVYAFRWSRDVSR